MNDSRERHHVVISGLDLLGTWKAVLAEEMGEKEVSVNGVGITLRIIRAFFDWRLRDSNRDNGAFRAPWWIELHPEGRRLRHAYWEAVFCGLSKDIEICEFVKVHGPGKIRIGGYSRIASEVILDGRGGLIIGGYALNGFKSILMTCSHQFGGLEPVISQGMESAPISIGTDVWLGARVIVLPGVTIGDHAVIGAGAVVTQSIPRNAIAVGNPAHVIRSRTVSAHESSHFD